MGAGDLAGAWALLRLDREYRAAWTEHAARPAYEEGMSPALPVRIRSGADRIAERDWNLLAFEDPDGDAVSAFFDTPMLEGEGSATAPPLVAMLEAAGARIEGLRPDDGALVLKVEADGAAVQVRIAPPGAAAGGRRGTAIP